MNKKYSLWVKKYVIIKNKMLRKFRKKNKYRDYEAHISNTNRDFYTTRRMNPTGLRWY